MRVRCLVAVLGKLPKGWLKRFSVGGASLWRTGSMNEEEVMRELDIQEEDSDNWNGNADH